MTRPSLQDSQCAEFRTNGVIILRGFYDLKRDVEPIQRGIYDIIGQVMMQNGMKDLRPTFAPERFDAGFQDLIALNRAHGSVVYDAVKQLPAFWRLVAHPHHEAVFKTLRHGALPGIAGGGSGIRIDNPGEDRFRAMWHQEYPAQLRSLDGLVFWSPLVPVTPELGPVVFCLGSHNEGPLPVVTHTEDGVNRSGAYALKLRNEESLVSKYPQSSPSTSPGDLVLIDFLTLHASGHNRGSRSRWSMQFRYFNFNDATGRKHGWKGSFAAGIDFRHVHPELCTDVAPGDSK